MTAFRGLMNYVRLLCLGALRGSAGGVFIQLTNHEWEEVIEMIVLTCSLL